MRNVCGFLGGALMVACAGHSTQGPQEVLAQGGAAGQSSAGADYVPTSGAPFNADHLEGGSFEGQQGSGWDTCLTRTSGDVTFAEDAASNGSVFVELKAAEGCEFPCAKDHESDAQVAVWFADDEARPAPAAGLYFDLINLAPTPPMGTLTLYAVDSLCITRRELAAIPLPDLDPSSGWSTRCVDASLVSPEMLGLAVQGSSFHIGIDALRFGPACQ